MDETAGVKLMAAILQFPVMTHFGTMFDSVLSTAPGNWRDQRNSLEVSLPDILVGSSYKYLLNNEYLRSKEKGKSSWGRQLLRQAYTVSTSTVKSALTDPIFQVGNLFILNELAKLTGLTNILAPLPPKLDILILYSFFKAKNRQFGFFFFN